MLDTRLCDVATAAQLDAEIRDILSLDLVDRGDEICGTLHVDYDNDEVKRASLVPNLQSRGVVIEWRKKNQ
jgi:hypothetical protein